MSNHSTTTTAMNGGRGVPASSSSSRRTTTMPHDNFHPGVAVIIGILSTMFSLTFLILLYSKHCRQQPQRRMGPSPPSDAGDALSIDGHAVTHQTIDIDALLPAVAFESLLLLLDGGGGDKTEEAEAELLLVECAVCLAPFERSDILRLLPNCRHAFHAACLDTWLATTLHSTCPLCRCAAIPQPPPPPQHFSPYRNSVDIDVHRPPSAHSSFRRSSNASDHSPLRFYDAEIIDLSVQQLIDIDRLSPSASSPPTAAAASSPSSTWRRAAAEFLLPSAFIGRNCQQDQYCSPSAAMASNPNKMQLPSETEVDDRRAAASSSNGSSAASTPISASCSPSPAGFPSTSFCTDQQVPDFMTQLRSPRNHYSPPPALLLQKRSPSGVDMGGAGRKSSTSTGVGGGMGCCRSVAVADVEMAEATLRRNERRCLSEITAVERRRGAAEKQRWRYGQASALASPSELRMSSS